MATLAEVRLKELESLASLRAANESKLLPSADCGALKVCVCQKTPMGAMRQCELCRDAFHSVCVSGLADPHDAEPWLCPSCHRSSRPPLDKILPLLASLQRIRVRLPEGDALRYMIERTVSWQRRAREVISSYELSSTSQEHRAGSSLQRRWGADSNTKVRELLVLSSVWMESMAIRWLQHGYYYCIYICNIYFLWSKCHKMSSCRHAVCLPRQKQPLDWLTVCVFLQQSQDWSRRSQEQSVFYTEQRCIPLQGMYRTGVGADIYLKWSVDWGWGLGFKTFFEVFVYLCVF